MRFKSLFDLISCGVTGEKDVRSSVTKTLCLFEVTIRAAIWVRVGVMERVSGFFDLKLMIRLDLGFGLGYKVKFRFFLGLAEI